MTLTPTAAALATQQARIAASRQEASMTQETHSPEPWVLEELSWAEIDRYAVRDRNLTFLARTDNPNARRIVAAVNACAGIPTEALEAGALAELIEAARGAAFVPGAGNRLRAALAKLGAAE